MSNIIVVGCGRVGSRLALMLSNYENNVCVIDRDPRAFASLGRDSMALRSLVSATTKTCS